MVYFEKLTVDIDTQNKKNIKLQMITFRISISTTPMEGAQQWFTEPQDKWQLITMSDKHRSAQVF